MQLSIYLIFGGNKMEFSFDLKREKNKNLYTQLYEKLKTKILKGKLEAHTRLPAIRNIANKNNINPATVVKAYNLLERDELIYKKVGSGSYVSPGLIKNNIDLDYKNSTEKDSLEMLDYGQVDLADSINFASATPSPSLFPVEDFKFALNKVLTRDKGQAFTYQKSQGYYPLRETISKYLKENEINTKAENIQIVSGAQQAIDLLSKILLNFGDKIVVEEPTYTGALSAFRSRKASIEGIKLEEDGMDLDLLEKKLKKNKIRFVYIMTSFQNPTGMSWSKKKKNKLLKLAAEYNFLIIEDDCLSELYFSDKKPLSLKSLDKEGRVIYIKSFSKIFMPGLRLAFTILPDQLLPKMLAAKHATDISSAGITQRSFDFYLREGLWEKHLKQMRNLFKKRFKIMKEAINQYLLTSADLLYNPKGGLYFWLSLKNNLSSEKLYKESLDNGVAFLPGTLFYHDSRKSNNLRLSFAASNEKEIKDGIKILADNINKIQTSAKNKGYTPLV